MASGRLRRSSEFRVLRFELAAASQALVARPLVSLVAFVPYLPRLCEAYVMLACFSRVAEIVLAARNGHISISRQRASAVNR